MYRMFMEHLKNNMSKKTELAHHVTEYDFETQLRNLKLVNNVSM